MPVPLLALGLALAGGHMGQRALYEANQRKRQSNYTDTINSLTELYGGVGGLDPMAGADPMQGGAMQPGQMDGNAQGPVQGMPQGNPNQSQALNVDPQSRGDYTDTQIAAANQAMRAGLITPEQGFAIIQDATDDKRKNWEWQQQNYAETQAANVTKVAAEQERITQAWNMLSDDARANPIIADYGSSVRQFEQIQNLPPDGAGDLLLAYGVLKIADPGARVTDADFGNVRGTGGIWDIAAGYLAKLKTGEEFTPTIRAQLKAAAYSQLQAQADQAGPQIEGLKARAIQSGVPVQDLLKPYMFEMPQAPKPFSRDVPPPKAQPVLGDEIITLPDGRTGRPIK